MRMKDHFVSLLMVKMGRKIYNIQNWPAGVKIRPLAVVMGKTNPGIPKPIPSHCILVFQIPILFQSTADNGNMDNEKPRYLLDSGMILMVTIIGRITHIIKTM